MAQTIKKLVLVTLCFLAPSVRCADSAFDDSYAKAVCGKERPTDPVVVTLCLEMTQVGRW